MGPPLCGAITSEASGFAVTPDLVSTIIPVYNRVRTLNEAVMSVLTQDYRPIEILIVDDGSTNPATIELIQRLVALHPDLVQAIRQDNLGPGLARESGRLAARGEFIQYLDSDDVLLPGKFTAQVAALRASPEADVAYGITLFRDRDGRLDSQPIKATGEVMATMFPRFLNERWWDTSTPLFRQNVCEEAGPWSDLRLEEDWEYDCRVAAIGGRLTWCPMPVSETRDDGGERLSRNDGPPDPSRLAQRARAQTLIHRHARTYGLSASDPAMRRFARSLFLLARQCGAAGLDAQAQNLCRQALAITRESGRPGFDILLYQAVARRLGWRRAAQLARVH